MKFVMILHKIWIINCGLSLFVVVTCLIGDKFLKMSEKPQIFRAVFDNLAHGLIGFGSYLIIIAENPDNFYIALICLIISSLIDVDHFIAGNLLS